MKDEQLSNFLMPHTANIEFEDTFFPCFVENANAYKYNEEILFNTFVNKQTQKKLNKTHQRFYEHVKNTKPIRSMMVDAKKQYLNDSKQINGKMYFCFHKGDHVRNRALC